MKITIILGSHRITGKNKEIAEAITQMNLPHEINFIRMAEVKINGCTTCNKCTENGQCVICDDFESIYKSLTCSNAIFIISPLYAPIPSRLTAFFERLTNFLFATKKINSNDNPLLNKPTAIFSYCSTGICEEKQLKMIFQKFVMKNYSFDEVSYTYLNNCENADEIYHHDIIEYVKDTLLRL